jgi:hypothetical protein
MNGNGNGNGANGTNETNGAHASPPAGGAIAAAPAAASGRKSPAPRRRSSADKSKSGARAGRVRASSHYLTRTYPPLWVASCVAGSSLALRRHPASAKHVLLRPPRRAARPQAAATTKARPRRRGA